MNVLDGLNKQFNGRSLPGKAVLEGTSWFADLHKKLGTFGDDIAKFSAGTATVDEIQKFLTKMGDSAKAISTHLHDDSLALALMAEVSKKRSPDDLGVEEAPSYMKEGAASAVVEAFNAKALECGVAADAWKASGIPAQVADVAKSIGTVKGTIEIVAGDARLSGGELDDRLFEIHYAATGQIGNRNFADQGTQAGLPTACAKLVKAMKRELMVVKAPQR